MIFRDDIERHDFSVAFPIIIGKLEAISTVLTYSDGNKQKVFEPRDIEAFGHMILEAAAELQVINTVLYGGEQTAVPSFIELVAEAVCREGRA